MKRRLALVLAGLALAGCVSTPESRSYSVAEVADNLVEWDGRTILVHGYVWGCEPESTCGLADSPQRFASDVSLYLKYEPDFNEMLAKARGYKVLVEVEVNGNCARPDANCFNWTYELEPKRLIRAY